MESDKCSYCQKYKPINSCPSISPYVGEMTSLHEKEQVLRIGNGYKILDFNFCPICGRKLNESN